MNASESIACLSVLVSAGALAYTIKGVNAARRATQLQVFDGLFREIKRLDDQYLYEFREKGIKPSKRWCFEFFNTVEYLAFLLNHNLVLRDELHEFYKDAALAWYGTFSSNTEKKDLDDPDFYPEFKRLHRHVKGSDSEQPSVSIMILPKWPFVRWKN